MQVFSIQHVLVEGSLSIVARVTDHPRVVRKWTNNVCNSLQKLEMKVIGLDAEYAEHATGKIQRNAVLQLCLEDDVLVYQLIHVPSILGELHDFLSREDIYFCAAAIKGYKQKLASYNLDLKASLTYKTESKFL